METAEKLSIPRRPMRNISGESIFQIVHQNKSKLNEAVGKAFGAMICLKDLGRS